MTNPTTTGAAGRQLAQFNYARARFEPDDPRMRGFVDGLDPINALADASPGFVWRLKTDAGHSIAVRPFPEDPLKLVTLSVWDDLESFVAFAYSGEHARYLRSRLEWFEMPAPPHLVCWWVEAGHEPSAEEARERLEHLAREGPSAEAFDLAHPFDARGERVASLAPRSPVGDAGAHG